MEPSPRYSNGDLYARLDRIEDKLDRRLNTLDDKVDQIKSRVDRIEGGVMMIRWLGPAGTAALIIGLLWIAGIRF